MKKTYIAPILNVESGEPSNLLCESFQSNVGLTHGGGSDGDARVKEEAWDIWNE